MSDGDIKTALEVQVCCLHDDGEYEFPDEANIYVRLFGQSWSTNTGSNAQTACRGNRELVDEYRIDCTAVRDNVCQRS